MLPTQLGSPMRVYTRVAGSGKGEGQWSRLRFALRAGAADFEKDGEMPAVLQKGKS
jgi:hypothetical protein